MKKHLCAVIVLLALGFSSGAQYNINTYAGNSINGYSGDGGQATAAEMANPADIKKDGAGNFYISDNGNDVIRMINTNGVISTWAGNNITGYSGDGGPATAAELNGPSAICMDGANNFYVSDQGNNVIRIINSSGVINTFAGNGTAGYSGDGGPATASELNASQDVVADALGNVYISDQGNNVIRVVNSSGVINTFAGNGGGGYSGDGGPATAAMLNNPWGICLDASGNLYIGDNNNQVIRQVNTNGIINTIAGIGNIAGYSGDGGQASAAELNFPQNVAISASGILYISDGSNNVIRAVNTNGVINTFAGNGIAGYSGDGGQATAAEINSPGGLYTELPSGNVYLADFNNNVIRVLAPIPLGVQQIEKGNAYSVYPNPSTGSFTFRSSTLTGSTANVEIYNILGDKVYNGEFSGTSPQLQVDLSDKSSGMYLYRIMSNDGKISAQGKLIIQ